MAHLYGIVILIHAQDFFILRGARMFSASFPLSHAEATPLLAWYVKWLVLDERALEVPQHRWRTDTVCTCSLGMLPVMSVLHGLYTYVVHAWLTCVRVLKQCFPKYL